jgi:hypothetical protein
MSNYRSQKGGGSQSFFQPSTVPVPISDFGSGTSALKNLSLPTGTNAGTDFLSGISAGASPDSVSFADALSSFGTTPDGKGGGFLENLNFDKIAQGAGIGKDIIGALMAIKQFGLAEQGMEHGIALDKANLGNQAKLAQSRLDLQAKSRNIENPGLFGSAGEAPQLQQEI